MFLISIALIIANFAFPVPRDSTLVMEFNAKDASRLYDAMGEVTASSVAFGEGHKSYTINMSKQISSSNGSLLLLCERSLARSEISDQCWFSLNEKNFLASDAQIDKNVEFGFVRVQLIDPYLVSEFERLDQGQGFSTHEVVLNQTQDQTSPLSRWSLECHDTNKQCTILFLPEWEEDIPSALPSALNT